MPQDRSLDEFLSGETESDADAAEEAAVEPDAASDEGVETEPDVEDAPDDEAPAIEPIDTTYASSPDGGECATCGDVVEERWRDGGHFVCEGCKNW